MPEHGWLIDQYKKMDQIVESWPKWAQEKIEKQRAACKRVVEDSLQKRNAFQQQAIRHGLNSEALGRAVEGIPGKYKPGEQTSEVNDDGNEPE